jgi:uncharacterized protein
MESVLITGGSGMIGGHLTKVLLDKGFTVSHLTRNPSASANSVVKQFLWDIEKKYIEDTALNHDYIINLAGANVSEGRWSAKRKKILYSSRVDSTKFLVDKIIESNYNPKAFISASGVGYYGAVTGKHPFSEKDPAGNDFLAKLCLEWEKAAELASQKAIRTVILRTPVVLSPNGGALEKLKKLAKLGVLSPLGSGKQYMPWIHVKDLVNCYLYAIKNDNMRGAYNAVADDVRTNREFTQCIIRAVGMKMILPAVPEFALKVLLGEMSTILVNGSPVTNNRIKNAGFEFGYQTLPEAISNCIRA